MISTSSRSSKLWARPRRTRHRAGPDPARARIECCLYGPRGYRDEVEKHVKIDEMMICAKALNLTGAEVCTST